MSSPRPAQDLPHLVDATMFWSPSSGGVRRYLLHKQAWLQNHGGWRHTIVTPVAEGPGTARVPGLPLPGSGGYRLPVNRRACTEVLLRAEPDLVEAGDAYRLAWACLDTARSRGIPAVAFCHSNLEALARRVTGTAGARVARRYARHVYSHFDLVFAPSRSMQGHLEDLGLANVTRQPLGVDTTLFHPDRRDMAWRRELCASLGLAPDTRLLAYVGRFALEKNLQVLADAVRRLGAPYALLCIGAGPAPPRGPRVIVRPYEADRNGLARLIASVDVMLHAGDQETFGLAVLEAMACGTPVVARAADGLAELVDDEVGAGVPNLRPEAFAEAIRAVCQTSGEHANPRSAAARQRARCYDWERVLPQLFSRYGALLEGRSPQPFAAETHGPLEEQVSSDADTLSSPSKPSIA